MSWRRRARPPPPPTTSPTSNSLLAPPVILFHRSLHRLLVVQPVVKTATSTTVSATRLGRGRRRAPAKASGTASEAATEARTLALEALRARVRPFIMRRKKEDVATDLPSKIEQTIFVQFGKTQLGLYNRILKAARQEIDTKLDDVGIEKSQMTILAALTRLRQVATDPRLLGLPEGAAVPPSAKMEAFKELITDVVGGGHKALVFSQFVKMQNLICAELDELGIDEARRRALREAGVI